MSLDEIRKVLRLDDSRVWLLIGLCVALVFTIQSVETATEGTWPHQRRVQEEDFEDFREHVAAGCRFAERTIGEYYEGERLFRD